MGEHRGILRFLRKRTERETLLEQYAPTTDVYADLGFTPPTPGERTSSQGARRAVRAA